MNGDGSVTLDTSLNNDELVKQIEEMNRTVNKAAKSSAEALGTIEDKIENAAKAAKKFKIEPTAEGIDEAVKELDRLNAKIEIQTKTLKKHKDQYDYVSKVYGSTGDRALELQKKILKLEDSIADGIKKSNNYADAINQVEDEMRETGGAADKLGEKVKDSGKSADKAAGLFSFFNISLGTLAAGIAQNVLSTLVNLSEQTKELRMDMAKLNENARDAGISLDVTNEAMRNLSAVTDETDSSVEALSNLLAAGYDENNLAAAVDALSGAVIKFPDTIKIESLADGLQETLATKEATGQFAELLERLGVNMQEYNSAIAAMSDEQARNYSILLLEKEGLTALAEGFKANNEGLVNASAAQYDYNMAMAQLGELLEPLRTEVLGAITELLTENMDTISALVEVLNPLADLLKILFDGVKFLTDMAFGPMDDKLKLLSESLKVIVELINLVKEGFENAAAKITGAQHQIDTSIWERLTNSLKEIGSIATGGSSIRIGGYAGGTVSATRGVKLVGENGPEIVRFSGGEQVYTANQTMAAKSLVGYGGGSVINDNSQYIFKIDDMGTFLAIERRMKAERLSYRMGYIGK